MSSEHGPGTELAPSGHGRAKGLLSDRASGSRIDARSFAPPPALADVVESLWYGRWSLPADGPHTTELLGDPCVHIVFERGCSRVVGVWTKRWVRTLAGDGFVRAAKLRAGAVAAFFDRPAHELSNRQTALPVAFGEQSTTAESEVLGAANDEDGLAAVAEFLTQVRRPTDADMRLAIQIIHVLAQDDVDSVEAWAQRCHLSTRHLQRLCRQHVGASPKFMLQRRRLQQVAVRIERGEAANLAALAIELGYADQAHLARDVRAATGVSPAALRERLAK